MRLTTEERRVLDGEFGELKRVALAKTVEYAGVVRAEALCEVGMAHLFCGAHPYLDACSSKDFDEAFAEMILGGPKGLVFDRLAEGVRCQADVFPVSSNDWEAMTDDVERVRLNEAYLDRFKAMGVRLAGTCVPYLTGFVPMPGEHYVSSESHAVVLMNSLWGAMGQADGLEANFWAAVCGRTPLWGLHDPSKRRGNALYAIEADLATTHDWDLMGHAAGEKNPPHTIPVFVRYPRPDIHKLKSSMASMATTSGVELVHFVGLTPEAPTLEAAMGPGPPSDVVVITRADLEASRAKLSAGRRLAVHYVSVGCPHLTPQQIGEAAALLEGRKVAAGVACHVWTSSLFKEVADRSGHTAVIERAGAKLLTNSCPLVSGRIPKGATVLAFDSAKQAHYMKSETKADILYGSLVECLDSAVSGRWEGVAG